LTQKLLRAVLLFHGAVEQDTLLRAPGRVTLGPDQDALFVTPPVPLPPGVALLEPGPGGYTLALTPGLGGTVTLGGTEMPAAQACARGADAGGGVRRVPLGPDDHGLIALDEAGDLGLLFQLVTPAEAVPRRLRPDPFLLQSLLLSAIIIVGTVLVAWFGAPESLGSELEIKPERLARYIAKKPPEEKQKKQAPDEAALAKKLAEAPRTLAVAPRAAAPRTEREKLEARVAKRGVLGAMDQLARRDSAVRSIFNRDTAGELSRSLDALVDDAKTRAAAEAGGGAGGGPADSTRGSSMGGGGTGVSFGQTHGGGKIDTGGAAGVAAKLHGAKERKVSVSVAPGDPSVDGGLPKEAIHRVVRAHQAGIKYCYETELVRLPKLGGKIVVQWRIDLDGKVVQPRIRTTTMNNTAVEACLVRQISRWHFPKPAGTMVEVSYPFLFRSGL
jgi:hypothetical protein